MNKILVIGDLHSKSKLSYDEYVKGGRDKEKENIYNFIINSAMDCDYVVLLGDVFNGRSNHPEVIREFTSFLERFDNKEVYIISGNHCKFGSGETALDYLREIKNKKWHIITRTAEKYQLGGISATFCPYFTKAELGAKDNEEALKLIMEKLLPADILFHHHTMGQDGKIAGLPLDINQLPEPVFNLKELNKLFKLSFGGHIHKSTTKFKHAIVSGSIFNNEVGETQKYIWKIDGDNPKWTESVEQIALPGRSIYKIENPTIDELTKLKADSIVKAIITIKKTDKELEELKDSLKRFDAHILVERIPKQRKKMHYDGKESILEFSTEKLLEVYAKEKNIDYADLKHGFELIRI